MEPVFNNSIFPSKGNGSQPTWMAAPRQHMFGEYFQNTDAHPYSRGINNPLLNDELVLLSQFHNNLNFVRYEKSNCIPSRRGNYCYRFCTIRPTQRSGHITSP